MQDTEQMTLGMWIDYIIEYDNMMYRAQKQDKNKTHRRRATQADFDRF